jgi:rhamnose transport system permease protein
VAGVVYTLRFASASPDGAVGYELSIIAAVLFGGVSIAGGVGTMWGVIAAVLSLGVIRSALQLTGFTANSLLIVSGALLLISVIAPKITEALRKRPSALGKDNTKKTIREVGNEKPTH